MREPARARVLVVDDNPATLYSTARVLRSADFDVTEAATGQQALDLALKGSDILMLDVNLPDIHGFDVCRIRRWSPP
jgi:CheY-like chemotaxis protein